MGLWHDSSYLASGGHYGTVEELSGASERCPEGYRNACPLRGTCHLFAGFFSAFEQQPLAKQVGTRVGRYAQFRSNQKVYAFF